jgi:hypothetical protein
MRGRIVVALAGLLAAAAAQAGSYMQSGGDLSYSTSVGSIWATEEWDTDRNLHDASCRREYLYNGHYLEYGQSYYHTLFGGINVARSSCAEDSKEGLGDLRLGIRGRYNVFMNHRTWEVEATIPTDRSADDPLRLGCGAFGLAGHLYRRDKFTDTLAAGAGIGVQLWEARLAHQLLGESSLSGSFGRWSPWHWSAGLNARVPLNDDTSTVNPDISDCGTHGKLLRGGLRGGYLYQDTLNLECGISRALVGEDVSRSQGIYCGITRLWKA